MEGPATIDVTRRKRNGKKSVTAAFSTVSEARTWFSETSIHRIYVIVIIINVHVFMNVVIISGSSIIINIIITFFIVPMPFVQDDLISKANNYSFHRTEA